MAVRRQRQGRGDAADLALAGKKDEQPALGLGHGLFDQPGHGGFEPHLLADRRVEPPGFDRKRPPLRSQHRSTVQQVGHEVCVERGGHDDQHEVLAQRPARFPCQCKAEIGIQRAFVEFVEDQRADPGQSGVRLQHSCQNTLGHDLDAGGLADLGLAPDPVADPFPDRLAQRFGHSFGSRPRRKATRFQHDDPAGDLVQQGKRHPCRLARAGRGHENRAPLGPDGRQEVGDHVVDR